MTDGTIRWPEVLTHLLHGEDLDEPTAHAVMGALMRGDAEHSQVAGVLVALRAKGESASEIAGFVRGMLEAAAPLELSDATRLRLVDIVGTGGDGAGTFNISTLAALVVAAAGVPVAKHGNRAASSRCGSADLLEGLGVDLTMTPAQVTDCLDALGVTFLYARSFHPAMRMVAPVRQDLGIRTVFNLLGPLSNPAGAANQAVGVADERLAPVMAAALARLGKRRALVFRGGDGLDELTTTGPSQLWEVRDGQVEASHLDPEDVGLRRAQPEDLLGGDVATNVAIAHEVLAGTPGPKADIVALNAAAGLLVGGAAEDLGQGVERAQEVLASGAARDLLDRWVGRAPGDGRG